VQRNLMSVVIVSCFILLAGGSWLSEDSSTVASEAYPADNFEQAMQEAEVEMEKAMQEAEVEMEKEIKAMEAEMEKAMQDAK